MGQDAQEHRPDLDNLILNCLERRTFVEFRVLAKEIGKICADSGNHKPGSSTLHFHLNRLEKGGKIRRQRAGYSVDRSWKEGQPKAFIFITSVRPKERGEHCQKKLADQLRESFRKGAYEGVNLISIDIVTGATYDVIAQVYSDDLHFIGKFVMDTLRAN